MASPKQERVLSFTATAPGVVNAIAFWFDLLLVPGRGPAAGPQGCSDSQGSRLGVGRGASQECAVPPEAGACLWGGPGAVVVTSSPYVVGPERGRSWSQVGPSLSICLVVLESTPPRQCTSSKHCMGHCDRTAAVCMPGR